MVDRPGTCRVIPSGPGRSGRGGAYGGEAPRGSVDPGLELEEHRGRAADHVAVDQAAAVDARRGDEGGQRPAVDPRLAEYQLKRAVGGLAQHVVGPSGCVALGEVGVERLAPTGEVLGDLAGGEHDREPQVVGEQFAAALGLEPVDDLVHVPQGGAHAVTRANTSSTTSRLTTFS